METKEMRVSYAEALMRLAKDNRNIIVVEADLMRASGTGVFAKAFPEQTVNVGVAEANLVGIASGLSAEGKIPFAATFGCFASRRAFDQFFLSANYAGLNVKLVGTDPGVTAGFNGGTHMPFEDIALMRAIPKLVIVEPSDPTSVERIVELAAAYYGSVYIRLQRKPANVLYGPGEKFAFGKSKVLREGTDVTLMALGAFMVTEALEAADTLKAEGISAAVIDALCVKPLDEALVLEYAKKTGKFVTCENHQASGGLGSAVAELFAEKRTGTAFCRIGVKDEFGQVGTPEWLADTFKLSAPHIVSAAKNLN